MPDQLTSPSQRAPRRRRPPDNRQEAAPAVRNNPARDTDVGPNLDTLPMPQIPGIAHSHVQVDDGCRLHVAQAGSGPALILVHGWPQHWYAWREVIAPLADHFRVICLDVRGLGWSDGLGKDWSLQRLARDVVGVMDALDIDSAGVIGHDWGAAIAYRTAIDHPDRVSRLMPLGGLHPWTTIGLHPRNIWRPWHVYTAATLGRHNNTWLGVPRIALRTWRRTGAFTPVDTESIAALYDNLTHYSQPSCTTETSSAAKFCTSSGTRTGSTWICRFCTSTARTIRSPNSCPRPIATTHRTWRCTISPDAGTSSPKSARST